MSEFNLQIKRFFAIVALCLAATACNQPGEDAPASNTREIPETAKSESADPMGQALPGATGTQAAVSDPAMQESGVAPIASLVEGLAARLQANPDDPEGWALLAKSYYYLGDTQKADSAKAEALLRGYDGQIGIPATPSSPTNLPPNHPPLQGKMKNDPVMNSLEEMIELQP